MVILKKRVPDLTEQALESFVLRAQRALRLRGSVEILVSGNAELRSLNRRFRGKDKSTDVLSFPAANAHQRLAGHIAISGQIAGDNAHRLGHPVATEIKILALHGLLHLAGYDHERDNGRMARKEVSLRKKFRLPSGLIERNEEFRLKHQGVRPSKRSRNARAVAPKRNLRRRTFKPIPLSSAGTR
jgi:probable rRNA maturation factor